ncbi:MAG TPA: ABC transporter permease [Gemmatimonadaceae bacterium]
MRRELDEELDFHLQMRIDELRTRGLDGKAAHLEALRRLGDERELKAYCLRLDERRTFVDRALGWIRDWRQDTGLAWRQARHRPAFTALAVLTLALGIGANSAIFSVVHRLLIAPLPYPDGNRIVVLTMHGDRANAQPPSGPLLRAWSERAHGIGPIAAIAVDAIMVQDLAEQDTVVAYVTPNYLSVLGLRPVIGRSFTGREAHGRNATVAMITDGLWRRSYGGRAGAIGSTIRVDGRPYTIVGVTPPAMGDPYALSWSGQRLHEATPSIFLPAPLDSLDGGDAFARLRDGVSQAQADHELQDIAATVPPITGSRVPQWMNLRCCARTVSARNMLDQREVRAVQVLFVAVGVLLLIACANVANLLMTRAWSRRREFAVRAALGAGRSRLVRLMLTESIMTALAGGALGVALAWEGVRGIVALRPPTLGDLGHAGIDPAVLWWSVGISVVTGVLFGSAPALFAGGQSVNDVLKGESLTTSGDPKLRRARSALIVVEIAMALVLLVGAGLLVRSFVSLEKIPLGFDPHGLVAYDVIFGPSPPPPPGTPPGQGRATRLALEQHILDELRAQPGVLGASFGPMPGQPWHAFATTLEAGGDGSAGSGVISDFGVNLVTPEYFAVTRMPLLEGRPAALSPASFLAPVPGGPPGEVVVDRAMAERLWPGRSAVGRYLVSVSGRPSRRDSSLVVGVAEGAHVPALGAPRAPEYFQPVVVPGNESYLVRVPGDPHAAAPKLRRFISQLSAYAVPRSTTIGDDYIRDALAPSRFAMALLGTFAAIALVLSAVGLYGMIAYNVSQRTREIGVRMALGARPGSITALFVREGVRLAVAGLVIGTAISLGATRVMAGMLYAVTPQDPATFVGIVGLVAAIALAASYVPTRRALRVDPTEALRDG